MAQKYSFWQDSDSIDRLEESIKTGKAIIISSDTVLGLSAPLTLAGFEALNHIKGRSKKPYLVILADKRAIAQYCPVPLPSSVTQLIDQCWPGPVTLILPAKSTVPAFLAPEGSIAIRIPDHGPLLELLKRVGGLFSTSANLAGAHIPETVDQLDAALVEQVPLIVVDRERTSTTPSTILDCTAPQITLIRQGAYPLSMLEKIGVKIV